jgi:hypothetical protein
MPLGYHITWGTYGTRLHGDARGTVDRAHNEYGTPVLGRDPERERLEREELKFPPVKLDLEQRLFIESIIPSICERGHWTHLTDASGPDRVHVVVTAPFDPEIIRRLLKRWIGQELSNRWPLPEGATWWAEDGSIRWLIDDRYYGNAVRYVRDQRITPPPARPVDDFVFDLDVTRGPATTGGK